LCAAIGYLLGPDKKTPLQDKIETPFTLEQVDEKTEWPLLIAIAWADSNKDITVFTDSKKIIKICEEYAEAGFQFLIKQYPFNIAFIDNNLDNAENADLEFNVSLLIKQLKDKFLEGVV
jgi:ribonuclease HI